MKRKLVILLLLILLIPIVAISANRIVKVGDNNVEVTPSKIMTDITGKSVEVWDKEKTKSYGQDMIDKELTSAQTGLTTVQILDATAYKQGQIDKFQAEVDKLNLIQTEMTK